MLLRMDIQRILAIFAVHSPGASRSCEGAGRVPARETARPMPQPSSGLLRDSLPRVISCSEFVAAASNRYPGLVEALIDGGGLTRAREPGSFVGGLREASAGIDDEAAMMSLLRRWRQRELVRIA